MRDRPAWLGGGAAACFGAILLALVPGCGILNPSLTGTVLPGTTLGLEPPEGTILIAVFNTSPAIAAAEIEVTKKSGGTVTLTVPVQPVDNDAANEADRALLVQDCDVQMIRLVQVLAALPTGGSVQQFAGDLPPLVDGVRLSCGKVVAITIVGSPPNLLATVDVF